MAAYNKYSLVSKNTPAAQSGAANHIGKNSVPIADNRTSATIQKKQNKTGLPDNLKTGIENISGYSMDNVKVHYNSSQPAQLSAHAYAQGTDIHIAPGQEKHLPHEAWHVVQQKQGRVKPTMQLKNQLKLNDDTALEKEADVMGEMAIRLKQKNIQRIIIGQGSASSSTFPLQAVWKDFGPYYLWDPLYPDGTRWYQVKENGLLFYLIENVNEVQPAYLEKYRQDAGIANARSYTDWIDDKSYEWLASAEDDAREEAVPQLPQHSGTDKLLDKKTSIKDEHAVSPVAKAAVGLPPTQLPLIKQVRILFEPLRQSMVALWSVTKDIRQIENEIEGLENEMDEIKGEKSEVSERKKRLKQEMKKMEETKEQLEDKENELVDEQRVLTKTALAFINEKLVPKAGTVIFEVLNIDWRLCREAKSEQEIQAGLERSINSVCNKVTYINGLGEKVQSGLAGIFTEFNLNPPDKKAIDSVTFTIKLLGGDSHNKGKVPVLIEFFQKGELFGKIVYKPRKAETDRAVIDLYQLMNEQHTGIELPVYKITVFGEGTLWQFVEGELVKEDAHKKANHNNRANLERLEQVTAAIGISDLHGENVILHQNRFIPIDLESYAPESETGLYGGARDKPANKPLSESEQLAVENFNKRQAERESRLVPVLTGVLEGLMNGNKVEQAVETIKSALTDQGFSVSQNIKQRLMPLITEDFQNMDIPMFTQKGGAVFFVGDHSGLPIAVMPVRRKH